MRIASILNEKEITLSCEVFPPKHFDGIAQASAVAQEIAGLHPSFMSVTYGAAFLRILCLGGPFSACAYALISFFQAVGKGMRSFLLAILRKGLLDIPLMFLLNRLLPIFGVVWATPITDVICCCISIAMFVAFLRGQEGLLDDKPATAEPVRRHWTKLAHS